MEQEQPGVLQQLTEQLRTFFDVEEQYKHDNLVEPEKVTAKDEKLQRKKFSDDQHVESWRESIVNDRGLARVPPRPNLDQTQPDYPLMRNAVSQRVKDSIAKRRGKYPRSLGRGY